MLGCAEDALGLRAFLEDWGRELVSTTKREGDELEEHLRDADVLITTPFWPVYVTKERLGEAENLKLILTARVGPHRRRLVYRRDRRLYRADQIGQLIAARLKPFDVETLYSKRSRLGTTEELFLGIRYATLDEVQEECDDYEIQSGRYKAIYG